MVVIRNLTKTYGRYRALNNLNLHIEKGDIFGFVGPNGAGKTTTMRIICGLLQADWGEVYVDGVDALNNNDMIKRKVGYVPDFFGVYDNFKVMEYMEFYGSLYGLEGEAVRKTSLGLLDLVNLTEKQDAYVDGLSRGMKQRLCVARALIHNPQLLILDEPASGLDPRARFELKEVMKNLGSMGKTIIISSHILPELGEMCNSIGVMEKGNLVASGKVEEITRQSRHSNPLTIHILENKELAIQLLKQTPLVEKISIRDDAIIIAFSGDDTEMAQLLSSLIMNGVKISNYHREEGNLETLFLEITGGAK
ncbi:MAG: ABC transporter ATP-binding protein [Lachnospiraceae bacterium]|nr:ABC transporter ATP-binding protein [Lachnospiraceae bacterium]